MNSPPAVAALAVALGLGVYLRTLHPSVAGGDSGELMVTAYELGTPHPPGYPTFAVSSWLASTAIHTMLPFVPLPMAMNAFHAILSSLALGTIAYAVALSSGSAGAALLAAGMFGFAPNVWSYAIATEVFPLNNLFSSLLVLLTVIFERHLEDYAATTDNARKTIKVRIDRFVTLSAFAFGLALTNQHTSVLFVVPLVLWVFIRWPSSWREGRSLRNNSIAFFLGLSPYLYLPVSNYLVRSPNSWGRSFTWEGFKTHFLRAEYGTFSLASKESTYLSPNYGRNTQRYFMDIFHQLGPVVGALAVLAHLAVIALALHTCQRAVAARMSTTTVRKSTTKKPLAKSSKPPPPPPQQVDASPNPFFHSAFPSSYAFTSSALSVLFLTWVVYTNFFNYLSNLPIDKPLFYGVQQRFWIQPLILTVFILGTVLGRLEGLASQRVKALPQIALCLSVAVVAFQIHSNFPTQDESSNTYVEEYGRSILAPMPNNSILFTKGDLIINSVRFQQSFLGYRAGEVLILDLELLTFPWYNTNTKEYIEGLPSDSYFKNVTFPGVRYFPGQPETYNLFQFVNANSLRGRRFFVAGGFKEGDHSANKFLAREYGMTREILTNPKTGVIVRRKKVEDQERNGQEAIGTVRTREDIISISRSMPDIATLSLPPAGRYADHTWEAAVEPDFKFAYHNNGLLLLKAGQETLHAQPVKPIPGLADLLGSSPRQFHEDGALPAGVIALLSAHTLLRAATDYFNSTSYLQYESARNAAVVVQELMPFATSPANFGRSVVAPHLQVLLSLPPHASLPHQEVQALIDSLM